MGFFVLMLNWITNIDVEIKPSPDGSGNPFYC
jgi:hypothetical protein